MKKLVLISFSISLLIGNLLASDTYLCLAYKTNEGFIKTELKKRKSIYVELNWNKVEIPNWVEKKFLNGKIIKAKWNGENLLLIGRCGRWVELVCSRDRWKFWSDLFGFHKLINKKKLN